LEKLIDLAIHFLGTIGDSLKKVKIICSVYLFSF
jgi:hypothetical protein